MSLKGHNERVCPCPHCCYLRGEKTRREPLVGKRIKRGYCKITEALHQKLLAACIYQRISLTEGVNTAIYFWLRENNEED